MSYVDSIIWHQRGKASALDADHAWGYVVDMLDNYGVAVDSEGYDLAAQIDANTYAYRVKEGASKSRDLFIVAKIDHDYDFDEGNHRDLSRCVSLTMEVRRV